MREALPALGFLVALVIAPFLVTAGIAWSILYFTNIGLLVGGGELKTIASDGTGDAESKVVMCSYFTSAGFVERAVDHKKYGYYGQRNCPWRISVSA